MTERAMRQAAVVAVLEGQSVPEASTRFGIDARALREEFDFVVGVLDRCALRADEGRLQVGHTVFSVPRCSA